MRLRARVRGRRAQRRMLRWSRYQDRCDALAPSAPTLHAWTNGCLFAVRTTPGYFRAEGWDTGADSYLRHGA